MMIDLLDDDDNRIMIDRRRFIDDVRFVMTKRSICRRMMTDIVVSECQHKSVQICLNRRVDFKVRRLGSEDCKTRRNEGVRILSEIEKKRKEQFPAIKRQLDLQVIPVSSNEAPIKRKSVRGSPFQGSGLTSKNKTSNYRKKSVLFINEKLKFNPTKDGDSLFDSKGVPFRKASRDSNTSLKNHKSLNHSDCDIKPNNSQLFFQSKTPTILPKNKFCDSSQVSPTLSTKIQNMQKAIRYSPANRPENSKTLFFKKSPLLPSLTSPHINHQSSISRPYTMYTHQ